MAPLRATAVIGVVLALAAALEAQPAQATFPGSNGTIVYSRGGDLVTVRPDGTHRIRITDTGGDYSPTWSPDGRRIADVACGAVSCGIAVMRADGSHRRLVSGRIRGFVQPPVWSPDGRRLVYADDIVDATPRVGAIWAVNPDGSGLDRLTTYAHLNVQPSWSPDGTQIVYTSDRDGDSDIFVMNADGSNKHRVVSDDVLDENPAWSPDGSEIVFVVSVPGPPGMGDTGTTLDLVAPDGTGLTAITDGSRFDLFPSWSPDGTSILFRGDSSQGAGVDLYTMASDGSALRQITPSSTQDFAGAWSPDSTMVTYQSENRQGDFIWAVAADGTGKTRLAKGASPDWQAVP